MELYMRYPEGRRKALTISYDDGVEQDAQLIEKMEAHGIKGTFNLNTGSFRTPDRIYEKGRIHRRLSEEEALALYNNRESVEVAVHTMTHPFLEKLPPVNALWEVLGDRKRLEELFGVTVHGMAYPFGTSSDSVVEALRSAGIYYSRTTVSTEDFRQPTDWLRLSATCHHNCERLGELCEKFVSETPEREAWLFYLWGHSYEFERDDNWEVIDRFFDRVSGRDDIWYATNGDIYDYTQAYEALDFSVDCSVVRNPSARTVWFSLNGVEYEIAGGETIKTKKE